MLIHIKKLKWKSHNKFKAEIKLEQYQLNYAVDLHSNSNILETQVISAVGFFKWFDEQPMIATICSMSCARVTTAAWFNSLLWNLKGF